MVTYIKLVNAIQVTYIFNFWHLGILALRAERQNARMPEIKNVG